MSTNCTDKLIGIIKEDCPCVSQGCDEAQIEQMAESASGLYLEDLEGGISLKTIPTAGSCKNLCEIMLQSARLAEKQLIDDISIGLGTVYGQDKPTYNGLIGENLFTQSRTNQLRYVGHKYVPQSTDGIITIKAGELMVNMTGPVDLLVYRVYKGAELGELVQTITVNAVANQRTQIPLPEPIVMPLQHNGVPVEWYVIYDRIAAGDIMPKNNKMLCNCGDQTKRINAFTNPMGVDLASVEKFTGARMDSTFANGLSLTVQIRCEVNNFVCREYDENNAISITMAYAARYKAGELLIEKVLNSPNVNRFTMQNREYLWGKRNHFRKEYQDRIEYITKTADIAGTDCYICRQTDRDITMMGILT